MDAFDNSEDLGYTGNDPASEDFELPSVVEEDSTPAVEIDPRTNAPFGMYSEEDIKNSILENRSFDLFNSLGIPTIYSNDYISRMAFKEDQSFVPLKKDLFSIASSEWETATAFSDAYSLSDKITSGLDTELIDQAVAQYKKAKELQMRLPPTDEGISKIRESVRSASAIAGQLFQSAEQAAPNIAFGGVAGATLGMPGGAPGVIGGYLTGTRAAFTEESARQLYIQSKGEILMGLIDPEQKEPIPVEIALPIAKSFGAVAGSLDLAGLEGILKASSVGANVSKRIVGIAKEGSTEAGQTLVQQVARYFADKKLAEFRNAPFEKTLDEYIDMYEAQQSARSAMLGTMALGAPGAAYQGVAKTVGLVDRLYQNKQAADVKANADVIIQQDIARAKEVEVNADSPLHTEVDPVTNTLVEGQPLSNSELQDAAKRAYVKGTNITDSEIDDVTVAEGPDVEAQLDNIESKIADSFDEGSAGFVSALYDHYSVEEADMAESLVNARANAMGMSFAEYVKHRGLSFDSIQAESVDSQSFVQFTEDNRTIIHAFQNSNIVDFVHEIGHVFRRDLTGEDARIVDQYVGVEDGNWTRVEEEKFARAWERYISKGKAPVAELDNVFKRLANWFSKVYAAIRGSEIDVPITPELRGVFDRMLTKNEALESGVVNQDKKTTVANEQQKSVEGEQLNTDDLLNELTTLVASNLKDYREKAEEVGIIYGEEYAKMLNGEVLFQTRKESPSEKKRSPRHKERLEDTEEGIDIRDQTLQAYTDKVTREYNRESGGIKRTKNLSKAETKRLQAMALVSAMKKMFDAGDKHGYRMAKAALKAFLVRQHARNKMQKKHKALRDSFFRKLSLGKAYTQSSRRYVKMDPKVASFLRGVDKVLASAKTLKGAKALFAQVEAGFATDAYITPEQVYAYQYLQAAVKRTPQSVAELKKLNSDLSTLIKSARSNSPAYQRRNAIERIIPEILKDVHGDDNIKAKEHNDTTTGLNILREAREKSISLRKNWREAVKLSTRGQHLYGGLLSNIQNISAYASRTESALYKAFDFFKEKQAKMTEIRNLQDAVMRAYAEAYGLTKPEDEALGKTRTAYNTFESWKKDAVRDIPLGDGNLYTRSELRYLYNLGKDETLTNRLVEMGITPDILKNLEDNILTDQDKAFAKWMSDFYNNDDTYNPINKVYNRIYGVDLGRRNYYIPTRVSQFVPNIDGFNAIGLNEFEANMSVAQFQMDAILRTSDSRSTPVSSGRIKERKANTDKVPLAIPSDVSLFSSFVSEMAHFKAYAEKAQFAAGILNDKRFDRAVSIEYGPKILANIREQFKSVMADGANTRNLYGRVDAIRNAYVVSSVAAAGSVFSKQLIGMVQYWEQMPLSDFISNMMAVLTTDRELIKEIFNSEYLKNRQGHQDRDLTAMYNTPEYIAFKINPTITNFLTLNIRLGDSIAIAVGGAALYRYYTRSLGMSKEEAMFEVARKSEQVQQSGMEQELTRIQTGGSFSKFISVYSSAPIQAARREITAVRDYAAGKISAKQMSKTIFIYHILVPGLFAGVSSLLKGDDGEDEFLKSLAVSIALGPFGAAYAIGEVFTYAASKVVGLPAFTPTGITFDIVNNITMWYDNLFNKGEMELDDFSKAVESVLALLGIGVPVKRVTRFGENMANGDPVRAFMGQKAVEE